MPYTLTFNTFIEKKPEHGENIVFLSKSGSFDFYGYEMTPAEVEYCWFQYENGEFTGTSAGYTPEDDTEEPEEEDGVEWKLHIIVNGYIVDQEGFENHYLWMNGDDYFNSLPQH